MAKLVHVKEKTLWKRLRIPKNPFDTSIFDGLVDVQELTDYELVKKNVSLKGSKKRKLGTEVETHNPKKTKTEITPRAEEQSLKVKKLKNGRKVKTNVSKNPNSDTNDSYQSNAETLKKKKGKSRKRKTVVSETAVDSVENIKGEGNVSKDNDHSLGSNDLKKKKGKSRKKKTKSVDAVCESVVDKHDNSKIEVDFDSQSPNLDKNNTLKKKKRKNNSRKKKVNGEVVGKLNDVSNLVSTKESGKKKKGKSQTLDSVDEKNVTTAAGSVDRDVNSERKIGSDKKGAKRKGKNSSKSLQDKVNESDTKSTGNKDLKQNSNLDMSEWDNLFVPSVLLKSLQDQGFQKPTSIQILALPSAIRDHKDILAAAETGSGKTLAFGIPVVGKVLAYQEKLDEQKQRDGFEDAEKDEMEMDNERDIDNENSDSEMEGVEDDEGVDEDDDDDDFLISDAQNDEDESDDSNQGSDDDNEENDSHPLALILEPTRELAVQVHKNLINLAKYTNVNFAIVVGGMAIEKQRRLLKRKPEVIIATPGRLWQLIQEGDDHLSGVDLIHSLVVDEADRMVEKGHYEELTKLLEMINKSPRRNVKRQSFVMSATLTMEMTIPWRLNNKRKQKDLDKDKLKMLTTKICVGTKPKVIDLTPKDKVAQSLTEMRVNCNAKEKDFYLYYFLHQHPGRTLVFANSKDCLRRLVSVFNILECSPYPLHADMQQRQRLKNLDRFAANSRGLLLASDVAARGLDIPNVDYVIHYQVPQTKENYVHRSGRTARASNVGLSVMLVSPEDAKNYRKIVYGVKNGEDLPLLPIDLDLMPSVKSRVELARTIDVAEYRSKKVRLHNDFFSKAAEEMDMILDEKNLVPGMDDQIARNEEKNEVKQMKYELSTMLKGTLAPLRMTKYPTKSGRLLTMKSIDLLTLTSA